MESPQQKRASARIKKQDKKPDYADYGGAVGLGKIKKNKPKPTEDDEDSAVDSENGGDNDEMLQAISTLSRRKVLELRLPDVDLVDLGAVANGIEYPSDQEDCQSSGNDSDTSTSDSNATIQHKEKLIDEDDSAVVQDFEREGTPLGISDDPPWANVWRNNDLHLNRCSTLSDEHWAFRRQVWRK